MQIIGKNSHFQECVVTLHISVAGYDIDFMGELRGYCQIWIDCDLWHGNVKQWCQY
jgi:hypothetical protein